MSGVLTRLSWLWFALGLSVGAHGCGGYVSTTRIVDGKTLVGRPIEPEGYALYLNAQLSELRGALHRARQLYLEAARLDPASAELWTRVGALSCRLKLALADRELERALGLDRWYAPAWVARARCELFRNNQDRALRFARAAQVADPEDLDTTLLLVEVHQAKGQHQRAVNQLQAFVLRYPDSAATHHLQQLLSAPASEQQPRVETAPAPDPALIHAILANDLKAAQARATDLRLLQVAVARLALELNRPVLANAQMTLLLNASPQDSELRALALLAAHRANDAVTFKRALALPPTFTSCSPTCMNDLDQVIGDYTAANPVVPNY